MKHLMSNQNCQHETGIMVLWSIWNCASETGLTSNLDCQCETYKQSETGVTSNLNCQCKTNLHCEHQSDVKV